MDCWGTKKLLCRVFILLLWNLSITSEEQRTPSVIYSKNVTVSMSLLHPKKSPKGIGGHHGDGENVTEIISGSGDIISGSGDFDGIQTLSGRLKLNGEGLFDGYIEPEEVEKDRNRKQRAIDDDSDGESGKLHVVSCKMDITCDPADPTGLCNCDNEVHEYGESRCVIPKARISHISRTDGRRLNLFCVGLSLDIKEADGSNELQAECQLLGGDNDVQYRVFVTKNIEFDEKEGERVKFRACLEPI
ncbi:hypothetical protein Bbelb_338010 [Branchiostoma belcheri]|nr:hypothetical protein Bbelb_338010 [Branchiostoma belcheri]